MEARNNHRIEDGPGNEWEEKKKEAWQHKKEGFCSKKGGDVKHCSSKTEYEQAGKQKKKKIC